MLFSPASPLPASPALTRRGVLAGGLTLGLALALGGKRARAAGPVGTFDPPATPNAFVTIAPDDSVTVTVKHLDMGQGVSTGLPTFVADELDADWSQMRFAFAPADAATYANLAWGPVQGTGGSTATANSWMQLRKAGAAMRAMLVSAAAAEWGVPESEITVARGRIRHEASGREAGFGAFAQAAAALPVPAEPRLKAPAQWIYIGKEGVPRLDTPSKTDGSATYSLDVRVPGMLTAVVAHPPLFGARVARVDAEAARAVPGVEDVVEIPTGVAVVARDTWSAMKGRDALVVEWDDARAETRSTQALVADARAVFERPGTTAFASGDAAGALAGAARTIEVEHVFPYLAHATMEPMNGTIARREDGGYEAWGAFQIQTIDQASVAAIMGTTPDRVRLNTLFAGGSFGRRAVPGADWISEAAHILKATGERAPIHLVWTREDDMRAGHYRPLVVHRVRAGLDDAGRIVGWEHRIAGKSIMKGTPFEALIMADGVDATSVEGARAMPYAIGARRLTVHDTRELVPVLWWRSVGHTHTAHAIETLIDELAHAAGRDPVDYRLSLLEEGSREAAVLRRAAEEAGWSGPGEGNGRGRGVSVHTSFGTAVAMVADVVVEGEEIRVPRIVCAVECGVPVNPDVIRAQVEGSVGFALATVLREQVTLADGAVVETNLDTYRPTRFSEMPRVEVHILPSENPPSGIGEPAVPTLAPAIANAVFAATGERLRSLPLDLSAGRGA
ncbi:xanthine dehydrogenase family protein molybdopterin-binding subunit [Salinarimonas ramus]|uniref:Oxidoreductase n=1 Tax=Salinarimonas ramus TaxID=690164 RepID=A0A917V1T5_9HYPH|nr:xanthine dehydrogenase family protein molybdopterin-binding subunit [Salinarimonas ramus]GGK22394.1 oxidoreductase [Salinarimonas ramus]